MRISRKYKQWYQDKWQFAPSRMRCCDCGLAHDIEYRVHKGYLQMRVKINDRATEFARRTYDYKKLLKGKL